MLQATGGGRSASDIGGPWLSGGYNLIGSSSGMTITGDTATNILDVDPLLAPLADNGGPTPTHALLPGSPAIDAGNPTACFALDGTPLLVDQRGVFRPLDGDGDGTARCDIGAFEYSPPCGPDSDGDGVGDDCDCAPGDASARYLPSEPELRVEKLTGASDAVLSWTDEAINAGPGTRYDVAGDLLGVLWTSRSANAPCLVVAVNGLTWTDARPVVDDGFYYLVRAVNACGPAVAQGWGSDSFGRARPACP